MSDIVLPNNVKALLDNLIRVNSLPHDELTDEYKVNIEYAKRLGQSGWTINGEKSPNDIREWIRMIESKGEEAIAEQFSDNDIERILESTEKRYINPPESGYLNRAIENYYSGRYTESAVFFLAFLDYRINFLSKSDYSRKKKQCTIGIAEHGKEKYSSFDNQPMFRHFIICDYIPSFSAYMERLFTEDERYDFDKGVEPPYLNRDWLMHGRMTRRVKKYECVQLINSLVTLADIEEMLTEDNNNG